MLKIFALALLANTGWALEVITYDALVKQDANTIQVLERALHEDGIVAVRAIPGYKEKVKNLIDAAQKFSQLPEATKEAYKPKRAPGETLLGYEKGKEKLQNPDGAWVVDDLKASYYGFVPDHPANIWPDEVDIRTPFLELGTIMSEVGVQVMTQIGLIGPSSGIYIDHVPKLGRMLHYHTSARDNPLWCGGHCDHGMFTALVPGFYVQNGMPTEEPAEAGLFVKIDGSFQKITLDDPDILLFQVGEFGQLISDDGVQATEHRVHKAKGMIERYTMALFFEPHPDTIIHSHSRLTQDARYGGKPGDACSYSHWNEESYKRYISE